MTEDERRARGAELAGRLFRGAPRTEPLPPEMMRHTLVHLFGDVWQGEELALEERSLVTCAALVALGREAEQRLHFRGARNLGIERQKIEALIIHVGHYGGWPVAASALRVLAEVWNEMDAASHSPAQ